MTIAALLFLSSGLFLGWSLGANDAANVFGTAVGSRMVRFKTAAIVCSLFVVLGAVFSGSGTSQTLQDLGAINALPGAFMVALAAALAVYGMLRTGVPVSTSQAIIGSIVGWNFFSNHPTDLAVLVKVVSTWVLCPLLAGVFAAVLMVIAKFVVRHWRIGLIRLDAYTRIALLLAGAFGSYSLGANNIANVVGVFIPTQPFPPLTIADWTLSSTQVLFLLGALAIALGVFTYSKGTMQFVGSRLIALSPLAAWVSVTAHSLVLFLFASQGLKLFLEGHHLPALPLVPVSSSQAILGALLGIGLLRGGREVQWGSVGRIAIGWVLTPITAGVICFLGLFFLQNVFRQTVFLP